MKLLVYLTLVAKREEKKRICLGMALTLMHLEYFVANLVREFEWKEINEDKVDLTQKLEFTVVMKKPLRAHIVASK